VKPYKVCNGNLKQNVVLHSVFTSKVYQSVRNFSQSKKQKISTSELMLQTKSRIRIRLVMYVNSDQERREKEATSS
jgi:hypothetical protein